MIHNPKLKLPPGQIEKGMEKRNYRIIHSFHIKAARHEVWKHVREDITIVVIHDSEGARILTPDAEFEYFIKMDQDNKK